ncbi:hypothetical protein LMO80_14495, partial [Staphylococcus aureus]|uniref:hypothetical protein n=1 Tax=Staphylococcus aureus TaxID=1280 RepID=UPI001E53E16A
AVASVQDLIDRLNLEFFGVSLRTHRNSCLTSSLRLTGVYWGRGDSASKQTERLQTKEEAGHAAGFFTSIIPAASGKNYLT